MRVTFSKKEMARALKLVKRTTAKGHEALSCVHISAGDGITVRTTDLDCGLCVTVGGEGEGEVALPAAELAALVEKSPSDEINLECENWRATLSMGRAKYHLNVFAGEFPDIPPREGDAIEIPAAEFMEALQRTVFAATEDAAMPILAGVCVEGDGDMVTVTATDGYRVVNYSLIAKMDAGCVIPAESVQNIIAMLKEYPTSNVYVYPGEHLHVESDAATCYTVPMAGQYPDVMRMIDLDGAFPNQVDKSELSAAIERASILADGEKGLRAVKLHVTDGVIGVRAESAELGTASDEVSATTHGEVDVLLNSRYILDALKHYKGETVNISFTTETNPLFFDEGQWSCYILPMRPRGGM